ncbi:SDR family oxidoreductase [Muricauda oceani]|uniref:SDR family oxidoreductase n=1 Tax=Flagellimonas oceani TaxID=2698672 RepID=A0A6G7IZ12_9FLAO|nr:SDR family oxidoreductase [Allomuricauda oceani]MBW8244892.1 SDR family oxidoreductase [Allomuricauda oceani]QII43554.1 SDR family oxidoreductase [Allomuricauda oceani]
MNFENKNVVITGGSTGIGFATAKAFIANGAKVFITGRSVENLERAAAKINNSNLKTVVSDTSNFAGIDELVKAVADSGSSIDVLFLNAGTAVFESIENVTEADFDAQFNTNVKGSFFTLQKLLPYVNNGASVLFTSSTVATAANMGAIVYSATKGALNKIAQIAANELVERQIRVNVVSPGPVRTEGFDKAVTTDEAKDHFAASTALQRLGTPDEIAKTVVFLASDEASFITGTELLVDGGYTTYARK